MSSAATQSIRERIRVLEQRLENRRVRLREDTDEAKSAAQSTLRSWLPVVAAAGAGLVALWLTRRSGPARTLARVTSVPFAPRETERRRVRWASLLGLATSAYKLGASPQAGILLDAFRLRRGARQR